MSEANVVIANRDPYLESFKKIWLKTAIFESIDYLEPTVTPFGLLRLPPYRNSQKNICCIRIWHVDTTIAAGALLKYAELSPVA